MGGGGSYTWKFKWTGFSASSVERKGGGGGGSYTRTFKWTGFSARNSKIKASRKGGSWVLEGLINGNGQVSVQVVLKKVVCGWGFVCMGRLH